MRIALAQINSLLGDFEGNQKKILEYARRALERRCDLVVFPEAALFGYHPVDLLERPSVVAAQEKALKEIHKFLPKGVAILVGAIVRNPSKKGKGFWNAAVFLEKGAKPKVFAKQLLPTYDVFDESRHIEPGQVAKNVLRWKGKRIVVTICEDIWAWPSKGPVFSKYGRNPLEDVKPRKADLVLNLSASPFTQTKLGNRRAVVKNTAALFKAPMVYVNMVGGQDELIFDGGSFAVDRKGKIVAQSVRFQEDLNVIDLETLEDGVRPLPEKPAEITRSALVLGLRDFLRKTGFTKVHLGLSGGIDSALVACLAVDALGPANVTGVILPGPFSSPNSAKWARELANRLGFRTVDLPITSTYEHALSVFEKAFGKKDFDLMNENMQARIRGLMLMALSNREGSMLLGTSNKSEFAVGYSTIYNDMIGGLMPIGDLLKSEVFTLCEHYNSETELIPREVIERPPSAELRENQKDQDSLPPYDQLDEIVKRLVVGFDPPKTEVERRVLDLMMKSEFKRWQAPPILKVSDHAFGRGRRFPVAHRARG
ncbi:MAG TPA: NAD+ synthase [Bdellovibrionales bacterium]|nr:NAD+ synthase [Bdellovibrionales bacterium]